MVTSDATIQDTVFGGGIDRMSAEGFCQELGSMADDRKEADVASVSRKNPVADRVSPDVLAKLKRLRDEG